MELFYLLAFARLMTPAPPAVQEIIERSSAAMEANWNAAPRFTYVERDVKTKHGGAPMIRTYRVFIIEGSQYNRLIAVDDKVLSTREEAREDQKVSAEIAKRKHETPSERSTRIGKYNRERQQDHALMHEMVNAFNFELIGEEKMDGHDVWALQATPKPGYEPKIRETRILSGMKGKLWVDKEQYQWVEVTAEVTRPVSMFLIAKVAPGTRFQLHQAQVAPGVWLPEQFSVNVRATALGFLNENSTDDESYREYRPMPSETNMVANETSGVRK